MGTFICSSDREVDGENKSLSYRNLVGVSVGKKGGAEDGDDVCAGVGADTGIGVGNDDEGEADRFKDGIGKAKADGVQ